MNNPLEIIKKRIMMILVNELERENRDIQSNERVEIKANRNAFDLIGEKFQGTTIRVV